MLAIAFQTRGVNRTHTPGGMSTGYSAATIDIEHMLSHNTVFVYGRIQGVGVTAYCTYNTLNIVKLKRWGQTL